MPQTTYYNSYTLNVDSMAMCGYLSFNEYISTHPCQDKAMLETEASLDIADYCKSLTEDIDSYLIHLLTPTDPLLIELYEAACYAVLGGGKRLRPLLCLMTADMYGVARSKALPVACALELIHSYSLIHDDLPAMDNDDFRRGKPTLHRVYSEGTAILVGDYLLTYAFEILSTAQELSPTVRLQLIQLLTESSGAKGMIGGQYLDLQAVNKQLTIDELKNIHRRKTGCLITAAIDAGALVGNVTPSERSILQNIGRELGLAFQIVDDLLDISNSSHKHSTTCSSDINNNKSTYATLLGIDEARRSAMSCLKTITTQLATLQRPSSQYLVALATNMICRNK
jgi:geranylgeranyl diphosphate synthase type II